MGTGPEDEAEALFDEGGSEVTEEEHPSLEDLLADEDLLLATWWDGFNTDSIEPGIAQTSRRPSRTNILETFEQWMEHQRDLLVAAVCPSWKEFSISTKAVATSVLVANVADALTLMNFIIPVNTVATAGILVSQGYIDELCGRPTTNPPESGAGGE